MSKLFCFRFYLSRKKSCPSLEGEPLVVSGAGNRFVQKSFRAGESEEGEGDSEEKERERE